jgi:hypothetical protein
MAIPVTMPDMTASGHMRTWIDTYCANERNPALVKFELQGPFNYPDVWKPPRSTFLERAGCYVIYGAGGELRYIGMSVRAIGDRLAVHFGAPNQREPFWVNGPKATFVEIVEVFHYWEAPSLEAYLIDCARGRGYTG